MRSVLKTLGIVGVLAALAACETLENFSSSGPSPIQQYEGETAYTQVNMWVDDTEHITTNYQVGWRLPINSEVRIGSTSDDSIEVMALESNRSFTIENVEKYSGEDIQGIYERYFAATQRGMSGFSASDAEAIRDGDLEPGMSKDAVLLARGYPPSHETRSTEEDDWKFWRNRFDTILVRFEDGRLDSIRN